MNRFFRLFRCPGGQQTANGMSISIVVFAILFLHLESAPTPAGADVTRRATNKNNFVIMASAPEAASAIQPANEAEEALTPEQRHERDLNTKIQLIEKGINFLKATPEYTAQFIKQELVNGDLLDEQEMEMKIRHEPFSIYLKWVSGEVGREVLYVDGQNDGRLTAHGGGWKSRLPAVAIELTSSMAMAESRYPVNKAGLYELAKLMLSVHQQDRDTKRYSRCEKLADQMFDGRPCHVFLVEYKDPQTSDPYRKSVCLIDKEWSIPVYTRNYGWHEGDAPADPAEHDAKTLIEFYSYSSVKFRPNLIAMDFDHTNSDYRFKRQ